jgi:hypothetical protein
MESFLALRSHFAKSFAVAGAVIILGEENLKSRFDAVAISTGFDHC